MTRRIYLDSAAAHPVRPKALRAFMKASRRSGNPSAPHQEGREAARILEDARAAIARAAGAKPDAVIFTSGATESNALAILGHVKARIAAGAEPSALRILYSPAQHASVIGAVEEARRMGAAAEAMPLSGGALDLAALAPLLRGAALVTADVVCGETGARQDTRAIRRMIDALPAGERPVFHADATQAPLVESIERTRIGADLISFDAQKIGGVRGVGALVAPRGIPLSPLSEGGGQERGLRSGTPSPALAAAFASALEEAGKERAAFARRASVMKASLIRVLADLSPDAVVHGGREAAPHILSASLPGRDAEYLAVLLDEAGVAVATRSACETDAEGSRVILARTGDAALAASTLRVSLHAKTRASEVRAFAKALASALRFLDSAA